MRRRFIYSDLIPKLLVHSGLCVAATVLLHCATTAAGAAGPGWKAAYVPKADHWRNTPQKLIFNSGADPETLDPHQVTALDASRLINAVFEGLVSVDPKTLEPRPGAAASWSISDDGLVYTFRLHADGKWSDGTPLTAGDFVRSFERALTPATAASYAELFFHIEGAKQFYEGAVKDFAEVGIRAEADHVLRIRLTHPCSFFLDLLTMPVFFPVRVADVERHGEQWTRPGKLVGNGAFVLSDWRPRDRLVFRKNANYWDAEFVKLEEITALCVDDLNTAYKLYLEGDVDWLPSIPHPRIEEIRRHPDYYVVPFLGTYFYRFNVTAPPFNDVRVRQAFCRATDREAITSQLLKNGQKPVASFCPEVAGYQPVDGLSYDPLEASRLLAAAGYAEGGKELPVVELSYNTNEGHKQIAEAIAQQWKRNLGVSVVTRNSEWKVFLDDMKSLNYQICRASWIGDYNDPSTFFDIFESTSGNNRTGWKHREYDRLLARTRREQDVKKRFELFRQMERILVEKECPIIPIYRYVNTGLLAEDVWGWYPNVRNQHPFKYMWKGE